MKHINQMQYDWLSYPTTIELDAPLSPPYPSVAKAGCGLCSACMVVEELTGIALSVEACVQLSVSLGANYFGTDMKKLGKGLEEKYRLCMKLSNDVEELVNHLTGGGVAIVNVGKPHGVFSEGGHFIFAQRYEDGRIWLSDPSFTKEKYQQPHRKNAVKLEAGYVIARPETVAEESANRDPAFYLFQKDGPGRDR